MPIRHEAFVANIQRMNKAEPNVDQLSYALKYFQTMLHKVAVASLRDIPKFLATSRASLLRRPSKMHLQ